MSGIRPSRDAMLAAIAAGRAADPLAPVTVVCPSHVAALQMRRALAAHGPFAAVRFETLPRLAELLAAGSLAAAGRRPLARPIGDHLAERVGAQASAPLAPIRDLPGFGRALRRLFARLRRAGLVGGESPPSGLDDPHLAEVMRLYGLWRAAMAGFYDEDDLLDAAADLVAADPACAVELGRLHLVPPGPRSAAGARLVEILAGACAGLETAADPPPGEDVRVVLAPDRSAEAREAARAVVEALQEGVALHRIAVLHGADPAYAVLLREILATAGVPTAAIPGVPLAQTPAGRGVLALLEVAAEDLSRTALVDAFGVAPLRRTIPAGDETTRVRLGRWDRLSRAAGVTRGIGRWRDGLAAYREDRAARRDAAGREDLAVARLDDEIADAEVLLAVVEALAARLGALGAQERPAGAFIALLHALVDDYLDPLADGMPEVAAEIDRLGTIDAVGGTFTLAGFARALRVNLDAAAVRDGRSGEGVLVADHRVAGGLGFDRVVLCGVAEGLLPAGPGGDTLVDDAAWAGLRAAGHDHLEDAARRIDLAREAAERALGCAPTVVLTCPLHEDGGARERYPSPVAVEAARRRDPSVTTASALRAHPAGGWLSRAASPLAAQLRGPAVDAAEAGLRAAVVRVRDGGATGAGDPLARPLEMLRARRGRALTAWDGNLASLAGDPWLAVPEVVSPTRLEQYGGCGFRFFLGTLLRVRAPESPADAETIEPLVRGNLIHETLELFFREQAARGRPGVGEAWDRADHERVQTLLGERLAEARRRGLTGIEVFAGDVTRTLRSDLAAFLVDDTVFRRETGARPIHFEQPLDVTGPHGQRFRGYVDRIDRHDDGTVWIVDYKTGRIPDDKQPLGGGTLLQLPVYLLWAGDAPARAIYWYITARGGFQRTPYPATPLAAASFAAAIGAIREGVAAGAFPAVPGEWNDFYGEFANCGRCDYTRVCALARGDDAERKAESDGTAPWAGVATTIAEWTE